MVDNVYSFGFKEMLCFSKYAIEILGLALHHWHRSTPGALFQNILHFPELYH